MPEDQAVRNEQSAEIPWEGASRVHGSNKGVVIGKPTTDASLNITFGGDFDADFMTAVNKIELKYTSTEAKSNVKRTTHGPKEHRLKENGAVTSFENLNPLTPRTRRSQGLPSSIVTRAGDNPFNVTGISLDKLTDSPVLKSTPITTNVNHNSKEPSKVQSNDEIFSAEHRSKRSSASSNDTVSTKNQMEPEEEHIKRAAVDPDKLLLSSWGLPGAVLEKYHSLGITQMFEWQAECLCTGDVLNGSNLVYSAPTSAGKTLVAELLVLKRVVETKKKGIIILPFVSVAREKMQYLKKMFQDAGIKVDGYMGNLNPAGGFAAVDVAICTIEKANSLINRLMEEGNLDQLGIIVVDELHMIGDSHRGYLLELLLTKVQYATRNVALNRDIKTISDGIKRDGVQIVGMSATLPNLDLLARWLKADLYTTQYRPVPLTEMVKIGNMIYSNEMKQIRAFEPKIKFKGDDENVINLCLETLDDNNSVLIFCPTKKWCENLADSIAREFYGIVKQAKSDEAEGKEVKMQLCLKGLALRDIIEQLKRTPVGLDNMLGRMIPYGVAYHHAGLTFDERDIVEGAFRQGALRILVATSTLSSGVNLPARRVIIRTPIFHGTVIETMTYKQMVGRAGRKGVDTCGESVLVCKANERIKATQLVQSDLPPVQSCLVRSAQQGLSSSMKRAILEVVVSGVASSPDEVSCYANCTMLAASLEHENQESTSSSGINECIHFLQQSEFIVLRKVQGKETTVEKFMPTQLGAAVLASALSPDEGLTVFAELQKARRNFVLENELHIVYLVTPIYVSSQIGSIDWYQYLCKWEKLSADLRRVAELVGVSEGFLSKAVRGNIPSRTVQQMATIHIHKRFFTALILHDLVNEVSISEVARKYNQNKGMLQSLQQSAATFSGMVTVFCNKLSWHNMELLLSQFQSRLTFGVQRELVDLVRVSLLTGQRARVIYNGGHQTVAALATADPVVIEALLKQSVPFESKKRAEGETEWDAQQRHKSKCIWLTGEKGLTEKEAAVMIIDEAKTLLKQDLGELGIDWQPQSKVKPDTPKPNSASTRVRGMKVSSGRKVTPRRRSHNKSNSASNMLSPDNLSPSTIHNITIISPPPGLAKSIRNSPSINSNVQPALERPLVKETAQLQHRNLRSVQLPNASSNETPVRKSNMKRKTPSPLISALQETPIKVVRMQTCDVKEENLAQLKSVESSPGGRLSDRSAPEQDRPHTVNPSVLSAKVESSPTETLERACALPKKTKKVDAPSPVSNSQSPTLFSENPDDENDEGFMFDTQTAQLICDVSFSAWGTTQNLHNPRNSSEKPSLRPCNPLYSGDPSNKCSSKIHPSPKCKTNVHSAHETPPLFSEDVDSEVDSATHAFMNNYSTQRELIEHTASPALTKQSRTKTTPVFMTDSMPSTMDLISNARDAACSKTKLNDGSSKPKSSDIVLADDSIVEDVSENETSMVLLSSYEDLQNDLDLALNMSDSFTGNELEKTPEPVFKMPAPKPALMGTQCKDAGLSAFGMSDSLSYSMLANVLDGDMTQEMGFQSTSAKLGLKKNSGPSQAHKYVQLSMDTPTTLTPIRRSERLSPCPKPDAPSTSNQRKRNNGGETLTSSKSRTLSSSSAISSPNSSKNDSAASDFIPPTPPKSGEDSGEGDKRDTPSRLIGGVSTPTRSGTVTDSCTTSKSPLRITPSRTCKKSRRQPPTEETRVTAAELARDMSACSSQAPAGSQSFAIMDVAADRRLFDHFLTEWKTKERFTICLACEKYEDNSNPVAAIGANFKRDTPGSKPLVADHRGLLVERSELIVTGLAVSWEHRDVYYISFASNDANVSGNVDESLCAPPLDPGLCVAERMSAVKAVLQTTGRRNLATICSFDVKAQYNLLCQACGIVPTGLFEDPKVACWLLDPGAKEKNLHRMVTNYLPLESQLLDGLGGGIGTSSMGLTPENPGPGRVKAAVESVLVNHLMNYFHEQLHSMGLSEAFTETEMPSAVLLAKMELNGMGFSFDESERQKEIIQNKLTCLEDEAYRLAGHQFSLTSPDDISQVLYVELKLPPSGDPTAPATTKTLGPRRATAKRGKGKSPFSTSKDILEKLQSLHPLPGIILEFRKISSTLSKSVFPLQREREFNNRTGMERIHGLVQVHTATGRVTMSEPNLQNIPNDYDIKLPEAQPDGEQFVPDIDLRNNRVRSRVDVLLPPQRGDGGPASFSVSMRHAFIPFKGAVILAADYSQLELRIIAHLSRDRKLTEILNSGCDVFKTIAAQWKGLAVDDVTPKHRQQAKQVCYGMVYGIGPKALGEQLEVDENDAAVFIESFKAKYTGMRTFLREVVEKCRSAGYVETVMGRRRYLPAIKDTNPHARSHAERQAVNTTVQGSAADLVKLAMVRIDDKLRRIYPDTLYSHLHKQTDDEGVTGRSVPPKGGYFILQLHDELIYEVSVQALDTVSRLVKHTMETAMKLSVKLPVKVKSGPSWASMKDMDL